MNEILKAREERSLIVRKKFRGNPLLTVKANTAGPNKNNHRAHFLVRYFGKLLQEKFPLVYLEFHGGADGPWALGEFSKRSDHKNELMKIEEEHPLGRLIDLDFFLTPEKSLSRDELGFEPRGCLACEGEGRNCARSRKHSLTEIEDKSEEIFLGFLRGNIKRLLDEAITMEASLDPKFGLVTIKSSGSHPDMDFDLMMRAKKAILEPLTEIFVLGYEEEFLEAFRKARLIGLEAERRMYGATGGVNCYKGLIFAIGIVLLTLGHCIKNNRYDIFSAVKTIGAEAEKDFHADLPLTDGLRAYHEHGIKGIRGEAAAGLPNVRKALAKLHDFSRESLLLALIGLIKDVEDTVLLKRAGSLEKYHHYRKLIGDIPIDEERIQAITTECIEHNLSFGGSADLLIVSIFLKKVEGCLKLEFDLSDRSV
ncbi:MAG: triphosphoribosyl-dephospho-CoA synthase [Bacilli bacterium]|jgi:holo-ACP synthase/triphosphoribosyl-dephospho-CoA synthase|nr:hypothetical protein [Acholeplasmataceae bacterium]